MRSMIAVAAVAAVSFLGAPTTDAGTSEFDPVDFFTDLFTWIGDDPPNRGDLDERLAPGSPAAVHVDYLFGFATARRDSRPGPFRPFTVTATNAPGPGEQAVEVCSEGFCDQFSGFVVDDGRLQTYLLNGFAIDDRLAMPTKPTDVGLISIGVIGAFERTTVDQLAVVLAIVPRGEEVFFEWGDAQYIDPVRGYLPVDLAASAYPRTIEPAGRQAVVLQFPVASLGGQVLLPYTTRSSRYSYLTPITVGELRP